MFIEDSSIQSIFKRCTSVLLDSAVSREGRCYSEWEPYHEFYTVARITPPSLEETVIAIKEREREAFWAEQAMWLEQIGASLPESEDTGLVVSVRGVGRPATETKTPDDSDSIKPKKQRGGDLPYWRVHHERPSL